MADVTRRRQGELVRKLFEILISSPDGLRGREALDQLRARVQLTDYEKGTYESGGVRFDQIVRFATVPCGKAGWLQKNKGRWSVTEDGKAAYEAMPDPEVFFRRAVRLYWEWKSSQPEVVAMVGPPARRFDEEVNSSQPELEPRVEDDATDTVIGKATSVTFEQAEEQAWNEIEQYMRGMNPYDFQDLVAALLRAMGYHVSWVAPPGKDGGIDVLAWADPLGTRPPRIKVQVKRQVQSVTVDGLRSFMAMLGEDDVGLFVATGGFTKDAEEEARASTFTFVRLRHGSQRVP